MANSLPRLSVTLFAVAAALWTSPARSFCRSTTCDIGLVDCQTDAYGCSLEGRQLVWPTHCIQVNVESGSQLRRISLDEVRLAARDALQTWTHADCGHGVFPALAFDVTAHTDPSAKGVRSAVRFRDDDWPHHDLHTNLAMTTLTVDRTTGHILAADVELNSFAQPFHRNDSLDRYDLELVLVHEMGHVLGLAHSRAPSSRMSAAYVQPPLRLRWLGSDDETGVCAAYPPTRQVSCGYDTGTWVWCETLEDCRWIALFLLSACWAVFGLLWRYRFGVLPGRRPRRHVPG